MPTAFTKPLRENFTSDGPKLRRFVDLFWISKETRPGERFQLDPWQAWLIDRILERYPDDWHDEQLRGQLRYEQCLISLGRQNGKTVLAAILSLYGLTMHVQGPTVLGLAESVAQANLVYNTAKFVIDNTRLSRTFTSTGTRGIKSLDESRIYRTAPGKADALQGITVSLCLYDEVHLTPADMWAAVALGTSAIEDGMVLGITTAGDEESTLLKSLYETGHQAVEGASDLERFGFFLWEAPDGAAIDDPEAIMAANPAIACGRKSLQKTVNAVRTMPEAAARQYVHNRFVASSGGWMPNHVWDQAGGEGIPEGVSPTIIAVDKTHDWKHTTIVAAVKHEGTIYTDFVGTWSDIGIDDLEQECLALRAPGVTFVLAWNNKDLAERLTKKGVKVEVCNGNRMNEAATTSYAQIAKGRVKHDKARVVRNQLPYVVRKNVGSGYKIVPAPGQNIEAVYAQVMAIYGAETIKERGPMIL